MNLKIAWKRFTFSFPQADELYQGNSDAPGIYTNNYNVMRQVLKSPDRAEHILQYGSTHSFPSIINFFRNEDLFVRCTQCHRTRELSAARLYFVSCKHCYTYYCSRECRANNWSLHSGRCSFARINTLCKDVIMKVREDEEAQSYMSKVARTGFSKAGRGSVNIRLASPQLAQVQLPPQLQYLQIQHSRLMSAMGGRRSLLFLKNSCSIISTLIVWFLNRRNHLW